MVQAYKIYRLCIVGANVLEVGGDALALPPGSFLHVKGLGMPRRRQEEVPSNKCRGDMHVTEVL